MVLRTSLVIAGDASSAVAALGQTNAGLEQNESQAQATAKAWATADIAITKLSQAQARARQENDATKASFAAGEIGLEQYNRELLETKSALSLVEGEHRQAINVLRQHKQALDADGVSLGSQRAGYMSLGRQAQDVAVQLKGGANLGTILSQQGPQVADALQMMGGRFAGLASFMAGPWGAAIFLGSSVLLDSLIPALFDTGNAAEEANAKAYDFSNGLNVLELNAQQTSVALKQLATDMRNAIAVQGDFLQSKSLLAGQAASEIENRLGKNQSEMKKLMEQGSGFAGLLPFNQPDYRRIASLKQQIDLDQESLKVAKAAAADSTIAASQARALESLDKKTAATGRYNRAVGDLNKQLRQSVDDPIAASQAGTYITQGEYERRFRALTATKNDEIEALKPPKKKRTPKGPSASTVAEWGEDAGAKIASIRDQFSDLPTAVSRSNAAMRQLDDIASDITRKNLPKSLLGDIAETRKLVEASLTKPFQDYLQSAREGAAIDGLLAAGLDDQAEALKVVLSFKDKMNPLDQQQLATVLETVAAERSRAMVLRDQRALIDANVNAVRDMRGALEQSVGDMLKGKFSFSKIMASIGNSALSITSQRIVESMFGDTLRKLEARASGQEFVEAAGKEMATSLGKGSTAVLDFEKVVQGVNARVGGAAAAPPAAAPVSRDDGGSADGRPLDPDGAIRVEGQRTPKPKDLTGPDPIIVAMVDQVLRPLGIKLPKQLLDAVSGMLSKLESSLPQLMKGALTGATASKLILGSGGSSLGGAVGGALGQKLGEQFLTKGLSSIAGSLGGLAGPIGSIAGGLLGGIVGGLFKKTKTGSATIGNVDGKGGVTDTDGNSKSRISAARGLASSGLSALDQIIDQLNGDLGTFSASIGIRNKKYVVDPSGQGKTKGSGVQKFATEEEANAALLADIIKDGAVKGVSAAIQKALQSSPDVQQAVNEALKVQEVELAIGGLGAQLEKAFKDLEKQAQERLRVAKAYGFDVVAIEQKNAQDRLKLTEQLLDQQVGSLQNLITQMTSGSLFEGSAVDQRTALLAEITKVRDAANAGEDGAAEKLSGLLEQLNTVSRDAYGTTGGFAQDRATITDIARETIAKANQRISDAQKATDPALATTNAALDENNDQNAQMLAEQKQTNALLAQLGMTGSSANLAQLAALARTSS